MKRPIITIGAIALTLATSFGAANAAPVLVIGDSDGTLGTVDVATGTVTVIGQMGQAMTDIGFDPSGNLWGVTLTSLYQIDKSTAATTLVGNFGVGSLNSLVFASDGTLYGADATGGGLYKINTSTGAATLVGSGGYSSSGDLAFVGGNLYLSSSSPTADTLFSLNTTTGAGTNVGSILFSNVYGLATDDNVNLYGVTGTTILSINTSTGTGRSIQTYSNAQLGAAYGSAFYSEAGASVPGPGGSVPEPGTFALLGIGLASLAATRRRKQ